jgi:hypothetical protein
MGFKEVMALDADKTISLGGVNKKTGKKNPTSIEGYYIGAKQVPNKYSKTGTSPLHIFQTHEGNVGVWGKTDLDKSLLQVVPGVLVRATFTGIAELKGGNTMYKYKVEADADQTIEVATDSSTYSSDDGEADYAPPVAVTEDELDGEDAAQEAQLQALAASAAARKAKVEALLKNKKN